MVKWKSFIHIQRNKLTKPPYLKAFWAKKIWPKFPIFCQFLKNLTSQSKCLEKRRFCEFIPLDMYERFSFYHFWIPQGKPFSKNIMFYPGTLGWNYCHFWGVFDIYVRCHRIIIGGHGFFGRGSLNSPKNWCHFENLHKPDRRVGFILHILVFFS